MKNINLRSVLSLLLWIGLCYFVAWTGAQVSPGNGSTVWYEQLNRPDWNPPAWLFGPVWTVLYTFMGIAAWRIWRKLGFKKGKTELSMFGVQLFLNGLWSQLFFGMQEIGWAFFEIFVLLIAIILTTILFYKEDKIAGWLFVPYALWVAFAMALNGAIWLMN